MQLSYKVHGGSKSIAADGMGLFLVKERTTFGSAIGGPEKFTGMAILLDSYRNAATSSPFPQVNKHYLWIRSLKEYSNALNPSVPDAPNRRISVFEKQLHESETS